MRLKAKPQTDIEALRRLLVEMPVVDAPRELLELVVTRLGAQQAVALARIWLLGPGENCDGCAERSTCPGQVECLHLAASAGVSRDGKETWSGLEGNFRRVALGHRKIGHVGASGEPVHLEADVAASSWTLRPEWAKRERILGFGGHPIVREGRTVGVLAVFTRTRLTAEGFRWLGTIAAHLGACLEAVERYDQCRRRAELLTLDNRSLRGDAAAALNGPSDGAKKVRRQIALAAATDMPVLIRGEAGTGKEAIARAIHEGSSRREEPLVRVEALSGSPERLEAGFTAGALFLVEVGALGPALQEHLLAHLRDPSPDSAVCAGRRPASPRILASTTRDLRQAVEVGAFLPDLYHRLGVMTIEAVPLRERTDDLSELARDMGERASRRLGLATPVWNRRLTAELAAYHWPGNLPELESAVIRGLILSGSGPFRLILPTLEPEPPEAADLRTYRELRRMEVASIRAALAHAGGKVSGSGGAAELLGIKPTTLASKLKSMGIRV